MLSVPSLHLAEVLDSLSPFTDKVLSVDLFDLNVVSISPGYPDSHMGKSFGASAAIHLRHFTPDEATLYRTRQPPLGLIFRELQWCWTNGERSP